MVYTTWPLKRIE